jgi:hypothetical protein
MTERSRNGRRGGRRLAASCVFAISSKGGYPEQFGPEQFGPEQFGSNRALDGERWWFR